VSYRTSSGPWPQAYSWRRWCSYLVGVEAAAGSFLLATVTNLAVKSGIVAIAGGRGLAARVRPGFAGLAARTAVLLPRS
jgi:uncharacterized membrane protein (DUF4010 family)